MIFYAQRSEEVNAVKISVNDLIKVLESKSHKVSHLEIGFVQVGQETKLALYVDTPSQLHERILNKFMTSGP
ncbi:hypothetical protein D3C74_54240 [compost metagenome]